MAKYIIVQRTFSAANRRRLGFIKCRTRGKTLWIDPMIWVKRITGSSYFVRDHSLANIAYGLELAGHEVVIRTESRRGTEITRYSRDSTPRVLAFVMLGLAIGTSKLERLEVLMNQYVAPGRRLTVWEQTARHYMIHPERISGLKLQLPQV